MTISVITMTANRPIAFGLLEGFMRRQTRQPDEWIVADGGTEPVRCTQGQRHLYAPAPPGHENFRSNLRRALAAVTGDVIAILEDDDHYKPEHLAVAVGRLEEQPDAWLSGDDEQRYYNLPSKAFRTFNNFGGCLCQTAFRAEAVPELLTAISECERNRSYGVDTLFWKRVPRSKWAITRARTVLGMKGLPGQAGLGIGHRPDYGWTPDPHFTRLREWIGEDVALYTALEQVAA